MHAIILALMAMLVFVTGCELKQAGETTTEEAYVAPDKAKVEETKITIEKQTFVLIDISGSIAYRNEMKKEVKGLIDQVPSHEDICVILIAGDSRSSAAQPWCRGLTDPVSCTMPKIQQDNFTTSAQIEAYKTASQRLEQEQMACEAKRAKLQQETPAKLTKSFNTWWGKLGRPMNTDISGSFVKAMNMVKGDGVSEIWVYSDMVEDLPAGITPSTPVLNGTLVHVRLISAAGQGYNADQRATDWQAKFTTFGAGEVDWKDFYVGEFASAE